MHAPEPLRTAVVDFVLDDWTYYERLFDELRRGAGDAGHWTAPLAAQVRRALQDGDVRRALVEATGRGSDGSGADERVGRALQGLSEALPDGGAAEITVQWPSLRVRLLLDDPSALGQPGEPVLAAETAARLHLAGVVAGPCEDGLTWEGGTAQLDAARVRNGLPPRSQVEHAVEWGRHRGWRLLSQDESLLVHGEFGADGLAAALADQACRKREYIEALLDAAAASCGVPGCLSCGEVWRLQLPPRPTA